MGQKLFVGNLGFDVNDASLLEAFSPYGTVTSAKIIMDRDTNRSKGFGFVEMSTPAEASDAINGLNGHELGGRQMNVSEARPMAPRNNRPFDNDRSERRPRY